MDEYYSPEKRTEDATKLVMSTRAGRRFVNFLLSEFGLVQAVPPDEPHVMAFNNGLRNAAIALYQQVDALCPEEFLLMLKESKEDLTYDREYEQRRAAAADGNPTESA